MKTFLIISLVFFSLGLSAQKTQTLKDSTKKELTKISLTVTPFVSTELQSLQDALTKAQNDFNKQIIFFLQSNNIDQTQILGGLEYIDEKGKIKDKISFTLKPTNKTANLGK